MIDICTGANGFLGKRLMQKIGNGALTVAHDDIHTTTFPDCDRFFFLSTYGNYVGQNDLSEVLRANVGHLGYVLVSYIEESKVNSFVFVSSSSVTLPVQTAYSRAKKAGEEMVLMSGLPACIVRPFSVTGVGEQPEHLIPTLIRSCMERERVSLAATPTHDFIDVQDVVDGLIALADKRATGIFELGTGLSTTNGEVLNLVEEICGKKANVTISEKEARVYDSTNWRCTNLDARLHGWAPKKCLAQVIQEMVDAYKFRRKHE